MRVWTGSQNGRSGTHEQGLRSAEKLHATGERIEAGVDGEEGRWAVWS